MINYTRCYDKPSDADVENYAEQVGRLTNRDLLDEYIDFARGDDWDGCSTPPGEVIYDLLKAEIETRLEEWLR